MLSDPRFEEEVSGCTASVAILSAKKIYVVGYISVRGWCLLLILLG
jgi:hypothetical protein